jgi:hypothetical protein
MEALPAELLQLIPSTYRCWCILGMVCRGFRNALAGEDYHGLRGYVFGNPDRSYHDYLATINYDLWVVQCMKYGYPVWFVRTRCGDTFVSHRGRMVSVCHLYGPTRANRPYLSFRNIAYGSDDLLLLVDLIYWELPSLFPHTEIVDNIPTAVWLEHCSNKKN